MPSGGIIRGNFTLQLQLRCQKMPPGGILRGNFTLQLQLGFRMMPLGGLQLQLFLNDATHIVRWHWPIETEGGIGQWKLSFQMMPLVL